MTFGLLLVVSLFVILGIVELSIPSCAEWLALLLMIGAGIPHGSFDLRVAKAKWRHSHVPRALLVLAYVTCALVMTSLCVFIPLLGFVLFLGISALHFIEGEAHATTKPDWVRGIIFGLCPIIVPIGLNFDTAQLYTSFFVTPSTSAFLRAPLQVGAIAFSVCAFLTLVRDLANYQSGHLPTAFERLISLCAWITLPPLCGFAVWFIGRHSRQHLELCKDMFGSSGVRIPLDFAAITVLAFLGLAPFALLFDLSDINQLFAASLSLIAGLTLPHMVVSHRIREIIAAK